MSPKALLATLVLMAGLYLIGCGEEATPTASGTPAATAVATSVAASPTPTSAPVPPTATPAPPGPAILEVRVTDAPARKEVLVTVRDIEVNMAGGETEGGWRTVVSEEKTFDLVSIAGVEKFLGSAELPPGRYNQVRLEVVDARVDDIAITVPSGKLRLVGGFDLVAGETTVLTLDFDAERSLVFRGKAEPLLKPVVRLLVRRSGQPLAGAASIAEVAPPVFPLTLTDARGQELVLESAPERIIAIDSAAVEMLFAFGEGDRVVGTHDFVDFPPETADIEKIGGAFALNHEKIVALEPDLVSIFFESPVAGLEELGLPVLYLEAPNTLEGIADRIRLWGDLTGERAAADVVADDYLARLADLRAQIVDLGGGPRVWHDLTSFFTAGKGSLIDHVYTRLGAQNIAGDTEGFPQLSPEVIVEKDPQVIVTTDPDYEENILNNPAFAQVSALENGRVVLVGGGFLSIAGPRMIDWTEELAQILYPELSFRVPWVPDARSSYVLLNRVRS